MIFLNIKELKIKLFYVGRIDWTRTLSNSVRLGTHVPRQLRFGHSFFKAFAHRLRCLKPNKTSPPAVKTTGATVVFILEPLSRSLVLVCRK